jgi:gluconolactonase
MAALRVLIPTVLELIDENAELEQLAAGFAFTEGPVWVADGEYLLFSDVLANRRHRWDERAGVTTVADPSGYGNGMTLDLDGRLVVCEGGAGAIARYGAGGAASREVIAATYGGRRLNSPNDVVVRSDGSIWFTDSWWLTRLGIDAERELDLQGVFHVAGGNEPEIVLADMDFPNGLCFSPDETLLYVNDSTPGHIRVLDVARDGSTSNDRVFATIPRDPSGHVDGMKCDREGNVWVTGPGGIWILASDGTHIGTVCTPERTGNFHWGGPGWSWIYVCSSSGLYRVRTRTSGRREPFMRG